MKAKSDGPAKPKYIDRPEISEVFADRLEHLFFDGATVRMEFTVTRTDQAPISAGQPKGDARQWAYTASRIVLSARGAAEMLNMMQELHGLMLKQGYLQPQPQPGAAPPTPPPAPETTQ
jgi:hypothetical protein